MYSAMHKYQYVVFDVDGTLLDTSGGIIKAVKETLLKEKIAIPSEEVLRTFIGPPIQKSFQKWFNFDEQRAQEIAVIFRDFYKQNEYLLEAKPYEGIYQVCQFLIDEKVQMGIATYKRQDYAEKIMQHFHFDKYTDFIYGADNENRLQKLDIIKLCLEHMGCKDYQQAVMIGDSDNDAIGAKKLGIDFIGVTYGFGFADKEEAAMYPNVGCAGTPSELLKLLKT